MIVLRAMPFTTVFGGAFYYHQDLVEDAATVAVLEPRWAAMAMVPPGAPLTRRQRILVRAARLALLPRTVSC